MSEIKPLGESYWVEPGLLLAGEHPGHWDDGVARRRIAALLDAGIRLFVDLSAPTDPVHPYKSILDRLCCDRSIYAEHLAVPLRENAVPDHAEDVVYVLSEIQFTLESGERVYVHCGDGVGRTGMVMGCWLVERGFDPAGALDELARRFATMNKAKSFHYTPTSAPQAEWVETWQPVLDLQAECSEAS